MGGWTSGSSDDNTEHHTVVSVTGTLSETSKNADNERVQPGLALQSAECSAASSMKQPGCLPLLKAVLLSFVISRCHLEHSDRKNN